MSGKSEFEKQKIYHFFLFVMSVRFCIMVYVKQETDDIYHLSRLALAGRRQDVQRYVKSISKRVRGENPEFARRLDGLLAEAPTAGSPLRGAAVAALPVDTDSRLQLIRIESPVMLDTKPIWDDELERQLNLVIGERQHLNALAEAGLSPSRALLFTGKPGVGKTMAARWLAQQLGCPLLTLDLSAVMSSFLGKTGVNVRHVLDYAKSLPCVLLLDELDAIAKRRDDATEIGELKRLVTVLLQEIDDWPETGLLAAATNHPELLDPAVWRRFDRLLEFPMPNPAQVQQAISAFFARRSCDEGFLQILAILLEGLSFSEIDRELTALQRESIVAQKSLEECVQTLIKVRLPERTLAEKRKVAAALASFGHSQREVSDITGLARPTVKKILNLNTEELIPA